MKIVLLVLLLSGCADMVTTACHDKGPPYTSERPTQPFHITIGNGLNNNVWFADGAPTVLTVHNPTAEKRMLHVVCNPSTDANYIDKGHTEGYFCVLPNTEESWLVQFMNRDAISQVCYVPEYPVDSKCTP